MTAFRAGIQLFYVLCALHTVFGARSNLQATHTTTPPALSNSHDCTALLLSSLSSVTTSGAGYSDASPHQAIFVPWQSPSAGSIDASSWNMRNSNSVGFEPSSPHKPLWPTLDKRDLIMFAVTSIALFIAAGGGIGGGAVFVPLFIIVGEFSPSQAVALSNITILGGAVANFIVNSSKRHAFRDTSLIDWDLIMVMEPTTMLGALLGSYANKLFPNWFTSCLMAALLVLLTWKLLWRGFVAFARESRDLALRGAQQQLHAEDSLTAPLLAHAMDFAAADYLTYTAAAPARTVHDFETYTDSQGALPCTAPAGCHLEGGGDSTEPQSTTEHSSSSTSKHRKDGREQDAGEDFAGTSPVPVPPGLKALLVKAKDSAASPGTAAGDRGGPQRTTPVSPCAFAVDCTPRWSDDEPMHDASTSPLLWSNPSSATAAKAGTDAAGCVFSRQTQLKAQQQQQEQQRWWQQSLLLPRHAAGSDDNSSRQQQARSCCPCSCLDPSRLTLSTVQAYSRQQLPWQPMLTLLLLSCWVVASDTGKAVLPCGSWRYWAAVFSVVPPCALVTLCMRQWLLARTAVEEEAAGTAATTHTFAAPAEQGTLVPGPSKTGGIHWTAVNSLTYPLVCSLAGVFAGLFGVGGGIVKGPLMLELGVSPDVAAATSATMIMFTAGSAAIVYVNFGGVIMDYAQVLLLLGFAVTLAGQLVATSLVRVLKRRSIIIFAMGSLMLLASVAATYQMTVSTRE